VPREEERRLKFLCSAAVAYLAPDAAVYVTGIVIPVDWGFLASGAR